MEQISFGQEHARRSDPSTSRAAAESMENASKALMNAIFADLRLNGSGTFEQISLRTGLRPDQVWRRLPDLEKQGLAEPTERTMKGSSGRQQRVWKLSEGI